MKLRKKLAETELRLLCATKEVLRVVETFLTRAWLRTEAPKFLDERKRKLQLEIDWRNMRTRERATLNED